MARVARLAKHVASAGVGAILGVLAGIVAGLIVGVGIAMLAGVM